MPEQIAAFCADKRAVLVIEEGQPEFIEQDIATQLRRADLQTRLHGKDLLPMGGEYTAEILLKGLTAFAAEHLPLLDLSSAQRFSTELAEVRERALVELGGGVPARPPNFCTGCPERPVFAALKLVERDTGKLHISTDIGCHSFATFEPFSFGNSILGYGMSMASSAAVKNFSAEVLVLSLGFDIYELDPQSKVAVTREGFARLGECIRGLGLPCVIVQEGGYHLETLDSNAQAFFSGPQAWATEDLGYTPLFPAITGGIFEFGFTDAIQQMWAAFVDELAGGDAKGFGCATPAEAADHHAVFVGHQGIGVGLAPALF